MRGFRYIIMLMALVGAMSCVQADIDVPAAVNPSNQVQVVGRVTSFSDRDVSSRAFKTGNEGNTASMCLVHFDKQDICKSIYYSSSSNPTFVLDKEGIENGDQLWIFANIPNPEDLSKGSTLSEFLALTSTVSTVDMPKYNGTECFPMYGSLTISDVSNIASILQVPLQAVYAKVVVNILSKPDQTVEGNAPARFLLTGYEVHNVVDSVDFVHGTSSVKGVGGTSDETDVSTVIYEGHNITSDLAQADKEASFYFYLPERFLKPNTSADDYAYPFKGTYGADVDKDQNGIRDEDENYRQRYKPKLVEGQNATFVRFFGEYLDHQGHNWNVSYDIYVGNDNYSNFDIEANTQYNNYVTIRGISNSSDQTDSGQTIAIDHRVNVNRVSPITINLRRETLLDSHFEVRPLRIRKNAGFQGADLSNAKVKVEVVYNNDDPAKNWVGIERSFGEGKNNVSEGDYLQGDGVSAGKRKYFTTNLTTETLAGDDGQSVVIPVSDNDETIWIYVDECTDTGDDVRSVNIRISFSLDGVNYDSNQSTDYTICQRKLFPVTYNGTTYNIEYYEEYLHNYDAEDSYHQTDYEGMPWGLNGQLISAINKKHEAILMEPGSSDNLNEAIYSAVLKINPYYDFYLPEDVVKGYWYFDGDDDYNNLIHNRQGYTFTQEIAQAASIEQCDLATPASSAVQYCLSKNKQGQNDWYLPAIDEMEDIVMSQYGEGQFSYSRFTDFRAKFYWSSQPAYTRVYVDATRSNADRWGVYQSDNVYYARATSVNYNNTTGEGASDPDNYHQESSGIPWGGSPWSSGKGTFTSDIYCNQYISGDVEGLISYSYDYNGPIDVNGGEVFSGSNSYGCSIFQTGGHKWSHTLRKPSDDVYEPGYKKRTDYARVRCVRK